jgi:NitT/TauT family transport system substrate-binding protein
MKAVAAILGAVLLAGSVGAVRAEVSELNVPLGAGGFGFLPLHMMQKHKLVEKHAEAAGLKVTVNWANIGGPSVMNDALLSGSAHFISAGPPAFLTLWDRTRTHMAVKGVAAMSAMPMYLNARPPHLKTIDDLTVDDKIAVTSVKVSIPSIIMQMYARQKYGPKEVFRFDPHTVSMTHPDALIALVSGNTSVSAHYASIPFHQREIKDPAIRTIMTSDDVMGGSTTFTMISTTTKFRTENPKVYAAFVDALVEAQRMINADKRAAAQTLLETMTGSGWSLDELVAILDDPKLKYTTVPENVMKYASFMHEIGSLKHRPTGIADLFFEGADVSSGN